MDIEEATEAACDAMDNIQDYDTSLRMYARAAVKALGWRDIRGSQPAMGDVVVCTDGTHRWLDKRTAIDPAMKWQGHSPTHWHPILDIGTDSSSTPSIPK